MTSARLASILLCGVCLCGLGCARYDVQVVDPSGRPVEGVELMAVGLTLSSQPRTTNALGWARIEDPPGQTPYWVRIRLPGEGMRDIPWPAEWPLQIVLEQDVAAIEGAWE